MGFVWGLLRWWRARRGKPGFRLRGHVFMPLLDRFDADAFVLGPPLTFWGGLRKRKRLDRFVELKAAFDAADPEWADRLLRAVFGTNRNDEEGE